MTSHKISRTAAGLVLASAWGICAAATTTRTASADIVSTNGLTVLAAPPSIVGDSFINNSGGLLPNQLIFGEQLGVTCWPHAGDGYRSDRGRHPRRQLFLRGQRSRNKRQSLTRRSPSATRCWG